MLKTEEVLVSLGLITLEEVKNPSLLENNTHSEEEITKILKGIIAGPNEGIKNYLESFAESYISQKSQTKKDSQISLEVFDLNGAYDLIGELSRAANLYVRDANPKNDFISEAWKTQIDVRKEDGSQFSEVELTCDPIYQKTFREILLFLKYNFEFFQE